jgi:hypothetical protein
MEVGRVEGANLGLLAPLKGVESGPEPDCMWQFVQDLVRTGCVLGGLIRDLAGSLPDDAYPDESNLDVVLEMMAGSLRPVAEEFGEEFVRRAGELLAESQERVFVDLQLAAELAKRREQVAGNEGSFN